ncbi:hypothetical protein NDU88_004190, partial [Pleurodeles waltl]
GISWAYAHLRLACKFWTWSPCSTGTLDWKSIVVALLVCVFPALFLYHDFFVLGGTLVHFALTFQGLGEGYFSNSHYFLIVPATLYKVT